MQKLCATVLFHSRTSHKCWLIFVDWESREIGSIYWEAIVCILLFNHFSSFSFSFCQRATVSGVIPASRLTPCSVLFPLYVGELCHPLDVHQGPKQGKAPERSPPSTCPELPRLPPVWLPQELSPERSRRHCRNSEEKNYWFLKILTFFKKCNRSAAPWT